MKKLLTPLVMILLFVSCKKELITSKDESLSNPQLKQGANYADLYMSGFLDNKDNLNIKDHEAEISQEYSKISRFIATRKQFRADQQVGLRNKPNQLVINVPGDYPTLQQAIDNSQPYGKIVVKGDIVNAESNPAFAEENVVLVDVPGLKIIGENKASISEGFILVIAENIEISKLKLNAYLVIDELGDGAKILDNSFTLPTNTYSFNATSILMRGPSNCLIKGNTIKDVAGTLRRGIVGSDSENNSFISNTISGGVVTQAHIELYQALGSGIRNNLIQNCILENGGSIPFGGNALRILGFRSGNTIKGCTVRNVEYNGIVFQSNDIFGPIVGSNNRIVDCKVSNYKGFGIRMERESLGLISGCDVSNKNADPVKTLGSEGFGLFGTDCKIINCNSSYNNGPGIVLFGNPAGNGSVNQIINSKANNNKFFGILYFAGFEQNSEAYIKDRDKVSNSALEIARKAGWDDGVMEIETRVKTAIAALEEAGYVKRGQNMPRVFADSILSKNAQEAIDKITASEKFSEKQKENAKRIIRKLFSSKSKRLSTEEIAESRIDYISDQLGIVKEEVIRIIELLREEKILAQTKDLTAFVKKKESVSRSLSIVENFRRQEEVLLSLLKDEESTYHLKEIIEQFIQAGIKDSSVNKLKTIINFWAIRNWIKRQNLDYSRNHLQIGLLVNKSAFQDKQAKRHFLAKCITEYLHKKALALENQESEKEDVLVEFSVQELKEMIEREQGLFAGKTTIDDIEDSLYYLSRIEAIKIEGGFLVVHNGLTINRLEKNNRLKYKESDYEKLERFYQQKVHQIHIVGEYARKMIRNYNEALQFVDDYFTLNYSSFLSKYFPGSRQDEIRRTLTPEKFIKLFGALSPAQLQIINDAANQHIVVAAGPGSGKTRVLVHKLASLLLTEDVKHEQLLMLTFSRAAATEFKKRLLELIGNAANFIEIKTFHSYCFDLLGRVGSLVDAKNVIRTAVENIMSREIETFRITKTVLVVDEAQDMNADEFALVKALMDQNEEMRVILVGDDDQNIYGFRGSDATYMQQLITEKAAEKYELTENYRSKNNIVNFSNEWATGITKRMKLYPCYASQPQNGTIRITRHASSEIIVPMAESIKQAELSGTTCVLTKTNEEANLLSGLLLHLGIQAKLIQSNDWFSLSNLYELRYFSDIVNNDDESPLIGEEDWESAKRLLKDHINASNKKDIIFGVIRAFEDANPVKKYKSDWKAFLFESKMEDFLNIDSEIIYVSTIHKAKGKEFDNLFLLLRNGIPETDEAKRLLYVAITRAKSNLFIHYDGNYLKPISGEGVIYENDTKTYPAPQQIAIYLTHRDVQLGYFEYVQHRMRDLMSGTSLFVMEEGLGNSNRELLVKYSKKFRDDLQDRVGKGFSIQEAKVNFLVYWKDEKKEKEIMIILPQLLLVKR